MDKVLIIRKSQYNRSLLLLSNQEKVYRVFIDGIEKINTLDYDTASNLFNVLENELN